MSSMVSASTGRPHAVERPAAPLTGLGHAAERLLERSPDLATRPAAGLPETGAGVKETFGPARGGVGRPAPARGVRQWQR